MNYLSCAPATLYRGGGFFEGTEMLGRLSDPSLTPQTECRFLEEVFPPFSVDRPTPALLATEEPTFEAALRDTMATINQSSRTGAASALVCLEAGFLHCNVLYTRSSAGVRIVYETHRANDRPYVPQIDPLTSAIPHEPMSDSQVVDLFIGSAGTGNYGHWLVDDLPRAAAVARLRMEACLRPIRIWLSDAGEPMNSVRIASLQHLCSELGPVEVRVARLDRIYDFKRLHYVTPISHHPVLKSPDATAWLARPFERPQRERRLFVPRHPERTRGLLNLDQVWAQLAPLGFESIDVEGMTFTEQAETFAHAEVVVGCMGAAMTNTLFAAPGTSILYLAPQGWVEPFYWDLAAVRGHRYFAVYGPADTTTVPAHLATFTIQIDRLASALKQLQL